MSNDLSTFQFINKYARFDRTTNRRETWVEAQDRVVAFMRAKVDLPDEDWAFLREMAGSQQALWAMRVLQMAGPSAERCNVGLYNCAYTPIERIRDFSDALYILMQGTGVGFSVEREYVSRLPPVQPPLVYDWAYPPVHTIPDSTEGWCEALRMGLEAWWGGEDILFDYSAIRPAGTPLLTKGGRASGPEPLRELLDFARGVIRKAAGRRLTSLEAHRIACKIGRIVEVGGVRRAAMLSLSDLDDVEMRDAKVGSFWEGAPELTMANNSVAYDARPSSEEFWREWEALARSGSGERGIFNRGSRTKRARLKAGKHGTNPCVSGDTFVATDAGPRRVKDLVGRPFTAMYKGKKYSASGFWSSGIKDVVQVWDGDDHVLVCTPDHPVFLDNGEKKKAGDLVPFQDDLSNWAPVYGVVPLPEPEEVFDCAVDEINRFVANGITVANCGEIKLNPRQFCNLTIAVVRNTDTREDLRRKVRAAAIMGTVQAACTDFRYIDDKWRETTESERLLGVDLLGALDNPHTRDGDFLVELRELVVAVNAEYADRIGIPRSTATTCIKPAGNSGVLLGTGNSVTGWYAPYFLRRVRVNKVDPMFQFLAESGVPWDEEYHDPRIAVFAFPQAAPEGTIMRSDRKALEQLEWWRTLQTAWAEHSVSATIYVRSDEWRVVGQWVWDNWDDVTGIAFLPYSDASYPLAPLEEISREEYLRAVARFPTIDWSAFSERDGGEDNTKMEFACTAGGCEI